MKDRSLSNASQRSSHGLPSARIGLGLAALGRPGYINLGHASDLRSGRSVEAMESHSHLVMDAAHAAGVRYFDAARSYGRSEAFLANWLASRKMSPSLVTVGSKWGYIYTADWRTDAEKHEIKQHTIENLLKQEHESINLLGSYLHLYQIHSATLESGVLNDPAILDELSRLQSTGMKIGLSLSGPKQAETLRQAMDIEVNNRPLFDCVQATWNMLERSAGAALLEAHNRGMGVIIKEGLANGRLTSRNNDPAFATQRTLLNDEAQRLGTTIDALALACILACPWVDIVLSGAATIEQLQSNLQANAIDASESLDRLNSLVESPSDYWQTRAQLPWN
jgi:aryl-alcohol dehydrogenase-like predicted oxidoreductase